MARLLMHVCGNADDCGICPTFYTSSISITSSMACMVVVVVVVKKIYQ